MSIQSILELYPKLSKPTVKLSALDVTSRAFFNWKKKSVIDYEHVFQEEEVNNKVNRKVILLNAFEALWILIILELRALNIDLNALIKLKTFLFNSMEVDLEAEEIKNLNNETLKTLIPKELLEGLNMNANNILNSVKVLDDKSSIYYTNISGLINSILMSGHNPTLMVYKEPSKGELNFYVFNPHAERVYYETLQQDYRDAILSKFKEFSIVSIPIKPLLAKFFESDLLTPYVIDLGFYTENELNLLSIIKEKAFDKITIYYDRNKKDVSFEVTSKKEITGYEAIQIRKMLGLKTYERIEVIHRNDKTLIKNKTIKYKT